jgi:predicted ABC-type ATPase
MPEPVLFIIAGCNGSGKSSFSRTLVSNTTIPFDYDSYFLRYYNSLRDSDVRDVMAHNLAFAELEKQIESALSSEMDFCYETNFNDDPLHWPSHFRKRGYKLHLIYLTLDSIEEAKRRVAIRVENGGHFVPESEIIKRYFDGFFNLNAFYQYFDLIDIFDSSRYLEVPSHILSIENGLIEMIIEFPQYLSRLIPDIANT